MTPINVPLSFQFDNELLLSTVISLSKEITYQKYGSGFTKDNLSEQVRWVSIFNTENHISKIKESLGEDFASFPIIEVLFFTLPPGRKTLVHRDTREGYDCPEFALNLPLKNSDNVCMKWYTHGRGQNKITTDMLYTEASVNLFTRVPVSDDDCIDQIYYTQPYITNILKWHDVKNESIENAYFISLRFSLSITHDQIISKFNPYIIV